MKLLFILNVGVVGTDRVWDQKFSLLFSFSIISLDSSSVHDCDQVRKLLATCMITAY